MKKPVVFELDDKAINIELMPEEVFEVAVLDEKPQRNVAGLFWAAAGALFSFATIISMTSFVENMFVKAPWLGWIALALSLILIAVSLVILWRELRALRQIKQVSRWHKEAPVGEIYAHFKTIPSMARGVSLYEQAIKGQIIDDLDKLLLLERYALEQSDKSALALISTASKRVSMVTALSPKALVDVAMVGFTMVNLLRRIAAIYGLRPGTLAGFKLMRLAFTHLAVTAGLAAGDTLISQFLGAGIAGRLSAKLGEGVVNGLLTARFGLAAQAICRPIVFKALPAPKLQEVVSGFMTKPN